MPLRVILRLVILKYVVMLIAQVKLIYILYGLEYIS